MAKAPPPTYPFVPKTNAHMLPGQFFSFQLKNGRYACGRVLATKWPQRPGSRTVFRVGLMDWSGDRPATADDLAGRGVLHQGWADVVVLSDYATAVAGVRPLEADGITPDEAEQGVYGREVLRLHAEQHFGGGPG